MMYRAPLSYVGAKILNDPEGRRQLNDYLYSDNRNETYTITLSDGTKFTIVSQQDITTSYHFSKSWWQQFKEWWNGKANKEV